MKKPGKRLGSILVGLAAQVPAILLLLRQLLDMHNRFTVSLAIVLPYAAIADRLKQPPLALILTVLIVTLVQYPLYGALIGHLWSRGRLAAGAAGIAVIHAIAAGVAIYWTMSKV